MKNGGIVFKQLVGHCEAALVAFADGRRSNLRNIQSVLCRLLRSARNDTPFSRPFGLKIVCALLLLLAACRKESERSPCLETKDAALRIKVSHMVNDTTSADSSLGSPVLIPVGGTGALRYTAATTSLQLYLSPLADSCRYVFLTDSTSTLADTLFFNYARQLRYISDACGYGYTFTLTSARATGTFIDSVLIRNTVVNTNVNSPAHVQIYLRP